MPAGFVETSFDGLTCCTLDGAIEQPAMVVHPVGKPAQLWQACTRWDSTSHRRDEAGYNAAEPYWHPVVRVGDDETPAAATAGV